MFSPRLLAVFAVLATAAAVPVTDRPQQPIPTLFSEEVDNPWFSFPPLIGNLFAPLWKLIPTFTDFGPKIIVDDEKFEVIVNVKDYKKEDLKVRVKGDFIFIQGSHQAKPDAHDVFASEFFHTYSKPANTSAEDITAQITSDNYLIVTALIKDTAADDKDVDRVVPIEDTGKPYKEDAEVLTTVETPTEPSSEAKPTTAPSDREEVTEKDNVIPHGNELNEVTP